MGPRIPRSLWLAAAALFAVAVLASYAIADGRLLDSLRHVGRTVSYSDARSVVDRRCVPCHSEKPSHPAFPIAPKGILLDTAEEMRLHAPRIEARAVVERTMPLANMTGMTDDERWILGRWVESGAEVPVAKR